MVDKFQDGHKIDQHKYVQSYLKRTDKFLCRGVEGIDISTETILAMKAYKRKSNGM